MSAGEGGGVPVVQPGQPGQGQALGDPAPQLLPGQAQIFRAEGHLLVHPGGEELGLEILEENPHPPGQLPGPAGGGKHPVHRDCAPEIPLDHPGDETLESQGQGGFPGLAGAQDREALPGTHGQVKALEHRPGGFFVAEMEVGDVDDGIDWLHKLPCHGEWETQVLA